MEEQEQKLRAIKELAESLQNDCHTMANNIIRKSDKQVSYQDAVNTWLFLQLAVLSNSINHSEYKEKYEKCIDVIKRFDPGIITMYDL